MNKEQLRNLYWVLFALGLGTLATSFAGCDGTKVQVGDWSCEVQVAEEEAEKAPEQVPELPKPKEPGDKVNSALWTIFGPIVTDHTNNPNRRED